MRSRIDVEMRSPMPITDSPRSAIAPMGMLWRTLRSHRNYVPIAFV
ncbi:MAG: hypothetical protein HC941_00300 [Microcoleus sp. SU_5_3]|nr:hypothetical protein [Microcoleus sp. SU_5_3]